ncbi:hypothetical protein [Pseudomonas sp. H2_H03]
MTHPLFQHGQGFLLHFVPLLEFQEFLFEGFDIGIRRGIQNGCGQERT